MTSAQPAQRLPTAFGSTAGDAVSAGAHPSAVFLEVTVGGDTFTTLTGAGGFDSLISGQLRIDGIGLDGLSTSANGVGPDGQFTFALHLVQNLVNAFVPGGGDPTQSIQYVVDPASDIVFGQILSTGPQGDADISFLPEWIALNAAAEMPEPAGLALFGIGLLGLAAAQRRS